MILEKLLDLYEKDERFAKRRSPGTGNPTGSALGKCAAQMQFLRIPDRSHPEPLSARAIWTFENGDEVERHTLERVRMVYGDALIGSEHALAYWSVPVTEAQARVITERMAMGYGEPLAIWGRVCKGFRPPRARIREEDGKAVVTPSFPIEVGRKTGFVLDTEAGTLWVPVFIDFAMRHPELGPHIVEVKAVSEYEFRRGMLGDLSYSKRAQLAAIVDATGLPALWLCERKNTQHLLEISYSPSVAGKVKVEIIVAAKDGARVVESFVVDAGQPVRETPDGMEPAVLPADQAWTVGRVWTPHDPQILAECRERVLRVLTWEPEWEEPWREYGPASFTCGKCQGRKHVVCPTCKGTGETAKLKRPCGPCGGTKTVLCSACDAIGTVEERLLPAMPCGYCPVKMHCFAPANVEMRFVPGRNSTMKPEWFIRREAWEASGIQVHTPPSLKAEDVAEPVEAAP